MSKPAGGPESLPVGTAGFITILACICLYLLFFVWLFALTGLLLNHSSWAFAQFYPTRKIAKFERPIQPLTPGSDYDRVRALMRQLGISGEVGSFESSENPDRLDFNITRPGRVYQVQADLKAGRAEVAITEFNGWGVVRMLHTFIAARSDDTRDGSHWFMIRVWAFAMDAVAAGLAFMVLSSLYMWWALREKRTAGVFALALGLALCVLFLSGLRWL